MKMKRSEEGAGHSVALGVGCNCGDRLRAMERAVDWLCALLVSPRRSGIYETEPVGGGTRPYLNAVVVGETALTDDILDSLLKKYELENGRDAECRARGDVPIDIDLVVSGPRLLRPRDFSQRFFRIGYEELTCTCSLPSSDTGSWRVVEQTCPSGS